MGLHHYQYSGYGIVKPNVNGEYGLDEYHDYNNGSDRHWHSDGLTCGRNGNLVGRCDNDIRDTYGSDYGAAKLFYSLNGRLR